MSIPKAGHTMTIALIGNEGLVSVAARIGLVAPAGADGLSLLADQAGHQVTVSETWEELLTAVGETPLDVVFCHESLAGDVPAGFVAPVLSVGADAELSAGALQGLLDLAVQLATRSARLAELDDLIEGLRTGEAIVGNTPVIRRLKSAVARAAECDATVLIEGPVGSGKSLAARVVHLKSRRGAEQIIVRDCATISPDELTTLIARGAETTLVLEAVDQLPANTQSVLVKHLKERSSSRAPSLVRVIATTSAPIPELVARGAFREDLFYRLHAFPIMVPGLHERVDDVQTLADAILDSGMSESGRSHAGFTAAARMLLENMSWPGNVAQLEATIRRSQALASGGPIDREHLIAKESTAPVSSNSSVHPEQKEAPHDGDLTEESIRPFEEEEKHVLGRALRATKGNVRRAAQLLGIGRATLYRKIQQYHLRLH